MKKAWTSVRAYLAVILVTAFVGLAFRGKVDANSFKDVVLLVIGFYFGQEVRNLTQKKG